MKINNVTAFKALRSQWRLSRKISPRNFALIQWGSLLEPIFRKTSISKIYARRINYKVFYYSHRNATRHGGPTPFAISRHTLEIFYVVKMLLGLEREGGGIGKNRCLNKMRNSFYTQNAHRVKAPRFVKRISRRRVPEMAYFLVSNDQWKMLACTR